MQGFVTESTKKKREAAAQNATLQVRPLLLAAPLPCCAATMPALIVTAQNNWRK